MQGIEELTFSFETMVQIVTLVIAIVSAWAYLKKNFEANSQRLTRVEADLAEHGSYMITAIEKLSIKIDGIHTDIHDQHSELLRIAGAGDVLAQRVTTLEKRRSKA